MKRLMTKICPLPKDVDQQNYHSTRSNSDSDTQYLLPLIGLGIFKILETERFSANNIIITTMTSSGPKFKWDVRRD